MYLRLKFMVVLLILLVPRESNASLFEAIRKLAERGSPDVKAVQMSPSPSPDPSVNVDSGSSVVKNSSKEITMGVQVPATSPNAEPIVPAVNETCEMTSNRCQDQKNMTACLLYTSSGSQGSFLLVLNNGESSMKIQVTIPSVNQACHKEIDLPGHQAEKISISANVGGSSSVVLNSGNGDCIIHMGGILDNQFPSYATYINGAYLLFLAALITGGLWACCKLGKREEHLGGVPYQELEMGLPQSVPAVTVETADGWDQGWDDDWDEEKAVKSPGGNHVGSRPANGFTSRSSTDGWGNDWDD